METMHIEVPCVHTSEIKKSLKGLKGVKQGGVDGSIDLINGAGDFLIDKFAVLFTKCLQNPWRR